MMPWNASDVSEIVHVVLDVVTVVLVVGMQLDAELVVLRLQVQKLSQ